jgi:hypothetical protein
MCKISPVPTDFVIVGYGSDRACAFYGDTFNEFTVRRAEGPTVMCKISPIPRGWVIVASGSSRTCPFYGDFFNTHTVRPAVSPMTICAISPIPAGYVITDAVMMSGCYKEGGLRIRKS